MSRSVWNNAGTWEEKDCTEWACGSVKDMLASAATDGASVVSVKKVKGESVGPPPTDAGAHHSYTRTLHHSPNA
jgi:hypothetical protein